MTATVVVSLELELGWGVHHLSGADALDRHSSGRRGETETLVRLLSLCDELAIPISFDVVGHLLLDSCSGDHDGPHDEGWFSADPGTNVDRDPLFYAPDLVQRIVDANVDHEICTHTFSHVPCGTVGESVVDWELRAASEQHRAFGLEAPDTLVPPMHSPPPREPLVSNGVTAIRRPATYRAPVVEPKPPASLVERVPWQLRESYPLQVLSRTCPIREPALNDGVVEHYTNWHASLTAPYLPNGQASPHPVFRVLPITARQWLHERFLHRTVEAVIEQGSYAHLWSHLFNLSNDAQWKPVESLLRTIARRRAAGELSVTTMNTLTNQIRDEHV